MEVKDIETHSLNRLLTFIQAIWVRVASTCDEWKKLAFLSVVNNILGLDVNIINKI